MTVYEHSRIALHLVAIAIVLAIAPSPTRGDFVDGIIDGQRVALYSTSNDAFVTAESAGTANVTANRTKIGDWEVWRIHRYPGPSPENHVAFQSPTNNQYLRANDEGRLPLDVQGAAPAAWEKIRLDKRNPAIDDEFGLFVDVNDRYVRAPGGTASLIADRTTIDSDETFQIYWLDRVLGGNGQQKYNGKFIGLYAPSVSRYVCAENAGTSDLRANRTDLGTWETFLIDDRANDGSIAIRAQTGYGYLRTNLSTGEVLPNASASQAERWVLMQLTDSLFALRSRTTNKYLVVGSNTVLRSDAFEITAAARFQIAWKDIDVWAAMTAFANNFPGKVKKHTKGYLNTTAGQNWGIVFHTEYIINQKLWLYEAFPKTGETKYLPYDYQHVWNGIVLQTDGVIGADCTIPYDQQGALWQPPIPRSARYQPVGVEVRTAIVNVLDQQIEPDNDPIPCTNPNGCIGAVYGTVYPPIMVNLGSPTSTENMGWRWVLELGLGGGSERWAVDLGPNVGIFQPRYGMVGYHAGGGPIFPDPSDDKRFFSDIQVLTPNLHRRHDCHPQP
jgi:hypothetical protein